MWAAEALESIARDPERTSGVRSHALMAEPLGVKLVQRRPHMDVRAFGLLGMSLRQERCARAKMVPAYLGGLERLGHAHIRVADDGEVVPERLEGAQAAWAEIEIVPDCRG